MWQDSDIHSHPRNKIGIGGWESGLLGAGKNIDEDEEGEKESEVVGRLCSELWKDRIDR